MFLLDAIDYVPYATVAYVVADMQKLI
jgi:hypothetical protein